jgi:hypothetical protein
MLKLESYLPLRLVFLVPEHKRGIIIFVVFIYYYFYFEAGIYRVIIL